MDRTLKLTFKDGSTKVIDKIEEYVSGIKYFFILVTTKVNSQALDYDRASIAYVKRMAIDGTWKEVKLKKDKKNGENS
jgi:hypothetical protein